MFTDPQRQRKKDRAARTSAMSSRFTSSTHLRRNGRPSPPTAVPQRSGASNAKAAWRSGSPSGWPPFMNGRNISAAIPNGFEKSSRTATAGPSASPPPPWRKCGTRSGSASDHGSAGEMSYEVRLDIFQGPLDLLLYLIKKNDIDIYNIPRPDHPAVPGNPGMDEIVNRTGGGVFFCPHLLLIKSRMLCRRIPRKAPVKMRPWGPPSGPGEAALEYQAFRSGTGSGRPALAGAGRPSAGILPDCLRRNEEETSRGRHRELVVPSGGSFPPWKEELMQINSEKLSVTDRINEILERSGRRDRFRFRVLRADWTPADLSLVPAIWN